MSVPANLLIQVQTYQMAELAFLQNYGCFISTSNKKFQNFQTMTGNLGDTVNFELPPRIVTNDGLVATFQSTNQRIQSLVCDKSANASVAYTANQILFNVQDYMDRVGKSCVKNLATKVEHDVAKLAETKPYRFFGDGVTEINSYGQLAQILADYTTYGVAEGELKVYLPDIKIPAIVNSGQNQFVIDRNEESARTWMVGNFDNADFYRTNLLPVHTSGSTGELTQVLTVVSTNDPTGNNITQVTLSGANISDFDAIKEFDSFTFQDNVVGQPNQRYLTFMGYIPSASKVQITATADAGSDGAGNVVLNFTPALCATVGNSNQNISFNVVAGMQIKGIKSHRCGLIVGGNALYLAMPQLPDQSPYTTSNMMDSDTGVSMRLYYGSQFGMNNMGWVHDVLWGKTAVPEYLYKIAFPLD